MQKKPRSSASAPKPRYSESLKSSGVRPEKCRNSALVRIVTRKISPPAASVPVPMRFQFMGGFYNFYGMILVMLTELKTCSHFGVCGGCKTRPVDGGFAPAPYPEQLAAKQ